MVTGWFLPFDAEHRRIYTGDRDGGKVFSDFEGTDAAIARG